MRTILLYLVALAALAVGAWFTFPLLFARPEDPLDGLRRAGGPPPVVVSPVVRASLADRIEALGTVQANESVEITPNGADHVEKIHFDDGEMVERGQLLVEMRAEEERALLVEARAVRDDRRSRFEQVESLFAQDASSQRELDVARTELAAAEARVIALEAEIADREVRAPFAGRLGLRMISEGAYAQPSSLITTLDDLSVVKVDFAIPETWLGQVRPGMAIQAQSEAWPEQAFRGEVRVVDTRVDPRSRMATVRARVANPEMRLRPGMLLRIEVERGDDDVLQVPEEALIPVGEEQFALVVDDDQIARRTEVEIGRRRAGTVEVLGGLDEGTRVVVEGIKLVRPDQPVQVVATREPRI